MKTEAFPRLEDSPEYTTERAKLLDLMEERRQLGRQREQLRRRYADELNSAAELDARARRYVDGDRTAIDAVPMNARRLGEALVVLDEREEFLSRAVVLQAERLAGVTATVGTEIARGAAAPHRALVQRVADAWAALCVAAEQERAFRAAAAAGGVTLPPYEVPAHVADMSTWDSPARSWVRAAVAELGIKLPSAMAAAAAAERSRAEFPPAEKVARARAAAEAAQVRADAIERLNDQSNPSRRYRLFG